MTLSSRSLLLLAGALTVAPMFVHAQTTPCRDPWINKAFNQIYRRAPQGTGNSGECNPANYGNGHWTTYDDLVSKVIAHGTGSHATPAAPVTAGSSVVLHLDKQLNLVSSSGSVVAAAGTFNLVSSAGALLAPASIVAQGGGNIVAQGGGNIVAQGGGNIVSQGGGNVRSIQSVGGRPTYIVK